MCFAGLLLLTPSASFHIAASFIFQLSPRADITPRSSRTKWKRKLISELE